MISKIVDFHCHLDLYPDYESLVNECEQEQIHTLTVTTTPKAWPRNRDIASYTKFIRVALGLHPQLVGERAKELKLWKEYLSETRYVGEVGLDAGPKFYKSFDLQKQIFGEILKECAIFGNKILTVHGVRAASIVLNMIETYLLQSDCKVVLHWFTGSLKDAKRAIDMGCYFSINAEMIKNQRHQTLLKELPLNRILTETDGPFTQFNGRSTRPNDVKNTLEKLALLRDLNTNKLATQIISNLQELES